MKTDPRVDAYISTAAPFARPLLKHLRSLVHKTCPEAEEAIKWRVPMFSLQGKLFCGMAAFKAHARFMVFGPEVRALILKAGYDSSDDSGSFGRLTTLDDLPPDGELAKYLRFGAELIARGKSPMSRPKSRAKPAPKVPSAFAAALKRHRAAGATFTALSPSCRREYIEWILGAKRIETKARRMEQALVWLREGKKLNWRYQN